MSENKRQYDNAHYHTVLFFKITNNFQTFNFINFLLLTLAILDLSAEEW